jgi:hypothetical protein
LDDGSERTPKLLLRDETAGRPTRSFEWLLNPDGEVRAQAPEQARSACSWSSAHPRGRDPERCKAPYSARMARDDGTMSRKEYERELAKLHLELVKLQ